MRFFIPATGCTIIALFAGCTTTTSYKPAAMDLPPVSVNERVPGRLLIYTTIEDDAYTFKGGPKSVTGFGTSVEVPFGQIVKSVASDVYGRLFKDGYDLSNQITPSSRDRTILRPKIEKFEWRFNQAKNAGFAITVQVNMSITMSVLDQAGTVTFVRTYDSGWVNGSTYFMSFSPLEKVNDAINKTLADLMLRSVTDLLIAAGKTAGGAAGQPSTPGENAPRSNGTGFFITRNGYLISNFHVVNGAHHIRIKTGKGMLDASVVKADPTNDIAILKVEGEFAALPLGSNQPEKLGESVFTVGFPIPNLQGVEPKLGDGKISGLSGVNDDPTQYQISVPLQPGNSGGPLVNSNGLVIGIVNARLSDIYALKVSGTLPQNVDYAIKIAYARLVIESIPGFSSDLLVTQTAGDRTFEKVVSEVQEAVALIVVD